jgi:gliding motility-associated-like protein
MKISALIATGLFFISLNSAGQLIEQEPNNTFDQANFVPINISMTGVTCAYPTTDFYKIYIPKDGTLRIITSISANSPTPTTLNFSLFSRTRNLFNDQYPHVGANGNAVSDTLYWSCLAADSFYIEVWCGTVGFSYCFNYTFTYTILQPQYANGQEPNDNFAQATPLAVSTNATGHLGFRNEPGYPNYAEDNDFYKIVLPKDGILRVITSSDYTISPAHHSNITLYSKTGNPFASQYPNVGPFDNPTSDTMYWYCLSADTMYLRIYLTNINDCGFSYQLRYDVLPPVFLNDPEPNNTVALATNLPYNTTAQGHLGFTNEPGSHIDEDYYRVVLPQDGRIMVIIQAEYASSNITHLNLSIKDKNGGYLNDQYPAVGANHIPVTDTFYWGCLAADTFYLRLFINNVNDCGITYSIKYLVLPPVFGNDIEPNNNFAQAEYVPLNTNADAHICFHTIFSNINICNGDDYFKIYLPHPGDLKLVTSAEMPYTPYGPLNLAVYNGNFNLLAIKYPHIGANSVPITDTIDFGCAASDTFFFHFFINNVFDCNISYRLKFLFGPQQLELGNDTAICGPVNLTLNAGSGFTSYLWNTGATTQTIHVIDTGYYSVKVTNNCVETFADTIHISSAAFAQLNLPKDTTVCTGNINIQLNIPNGFTNIHWSTGSISQQIVVTSPGTYWVNAQSSCGTVSDTIHVFAGNIQTTALNTQSFIINTGDSLPLTACANSSHYLWNTGGITNCDTCKTIIVAPVLSPSLYMCTVSDNICKYVCKFNIAVAKIPDGLVLPGAFTPNGDGLNDIFRIIHGSNIQLNYFRIYNRWGEMIFSTSDISKGWDGMFKGKKADSDIYAWLISATDARTGRKILKTGTVLLVR